MPTIELMSMSDAYLAVAMSVLASFFITSVIRSLFLLRIDRMISLAFSASFF
jgi:hypothetical protein